MTGSRSAHLVLVVVLGILVAAPGAAPRGDGESLRLDNLTRLGRHPARVVGAPRVVESSLGPVIEFNGRTDGLFLDVNPLAGLERFTVEVLFQPDADGPEEQRFVHFEERGTGSRALIELRMTPGRTWALDTYLRAGETGLTLLDREIRHRTDDWHTAALTYDGATMVHYVNGLKELSGAIGFPPMGKGTASLGVRQNEVSWFKGRIHSVRISPEALPADRLLRVPGVDRADVIELWPEGVPGRKAGAGDERLEDGSIYNVQVPTLTYVPPAPGTSTGVAVVVCPGGAYLRLAMAKEAAAVAARLRDRGVATFILKYRLVDYGHPAPLQDVLRAVRIVRSRAAEFGIRPDRIGVMGASAGGHVAASAAALHDAPEGRTSATLDTTSARPDFVALLYPVITMEPPFAHDASRRNLLGGSPSAALVERMSLEKQVHPNVPPVFLVHTAEDRSVPLENSLAFYQALRKAGVPAELHLYDRGPHGFGTGEGLGTTSGWFERWMEWMEALQKD